jgi:hypothetical protein
LTEALGGEANPWDVLTGTLTGAVTGGAKGLAAGAPGGAITKLLTGIATSQAGSNTAQFLRSILPGDPTHFEPGDRESPFPSSETMQRFAGAAQADRAEMEKERLREAMAEFEAAKAGKLAEYRQKKAEWEAAYAKAMNEAVAKQEAAYAAALADRDARFQAKLAERNAKLAEFHEKMKTQEGQVAAMKAEREAALERLRQQALTYLEQANAAKAKPFPMEQVTPVFTPPAPPPPFDPFKPDQPVSLDPFMPMGPQPKFAGDFPVSQEPTAQAPTAAEPVSVKADLDRLPLNIQQLAAQLATTPSKLKRRHALYG